MAAEKQSKVKKSLTEEEWAKIRSTIEQLRYGTVTVIVQDGKIVQVEKLEKFRF